MTVMRCCVSPAVLMSPTHFNPLSHDTARPAMFTRPSCRAHATYPPTTRQVRREMAAELGPDGASAIADLQLPAFDGNVITPGEAAVHVGGSASRLLRVWHGTMCWARDAGGLDWCQGTIQAGLGSCAGHEPSAGMSPALAGPSPGMNQPALA